MQLGRNLEAREAFNRAISLAGAAEAAHIRLHLDRLAKDGEEAAEAYRRPWASRRRLPRTMDPTPPNPTIIIAQVEGSGTADIHVRKFKS